MSRRCLLVLNISVGEGLDPPLTHRYLSITIYPAILPICHSERNEVESRNLRISGIFDVNSVRRSLRALRLVGMTYLEAGWIIPANRPVRFREGQDPPLQLDLRKGFRFVTIKKNIGKRSG